MTRFTLYPSLTVPVVAATTAAVVVSSWFEPWTDPVRRKVSVANYQTTTIGQPPIVSFSYFNPLSEPKRSKKDYWKQAYFDPSFVPTGETITVDKWFEPLSNPTRRKPSSDRSFAAAPAFSPTATISITTLSSPVTYRKTLIYQALALPYVVTQETITVDKWFEAWLDPSRRKKFAQQSDYTAPVTTPAAEVITVDKWFESWPEPKRRKPLADRDYSADVVTQEVITVDRWFRPWEEPRRFKKSLSVRHQQAFVTDHKLPTVSFGFYEWLSQPRSWPRRFIPQVFTEARDQVATIVTVTIAATEIDTDTAAISASVYNRPIRAYVSIVET